jgi:hypothetical protein
MIAKDIIDEIKVTLKKDQVKNLFVSVRTLMMYLRIPLIPIPLIPPIAAQTS